MLWKPLVWSWRLFSVFSLISRASSLLGASNSIWKISNFERKWCMKIILIIGCKSWLFDDSSDCLLRHLDYNWKHFRKQKNVSMHIRHFFSFCCKNLKIFFLQNLCGEEAFDVFNCILNGPVFDVRWTSSKRIWWHVNCCFSREVRLWIEHDCFLLWKSAQCR